MTEPKAAGAAVLALDKEQRRFFLDKGYLRLEACIPKAVVAEWVGSACEALGIDPADPKTWKEERVFVREGTRSHPISELAPRAWAAACELVGGLERVHEPEKHTLSDAFIIKFSVPPFRPWQPPGTSASENWHVDAEEPRRYLDSPDAGLVVFVLWSDIAPKGGGTVLACDSVGPVARLLAERPAGVLKADMPVRKIVFGGCKDFVELTGEAGDVYLVHPLMLHSESRNASPKPRFLTNRMVLLKEPMAFDREASALSPVEAATLRGLGRERFAFKRSPA